MSKISGFKRGFTLVEVALFLAVTGALFVGIALGTQNTITRQRYNDSVQNFAEFLRGIYSEVSNPQSVSTGRSETTAIYGKLVVFGENTGLNSDADNKVVLDNGIDGEGSQRIYVYDVVGDAAGSGTGTGTGSVAGLLVGLNANVVVPIGSDGDIKDKVLILKGTVTNGIATARVYNKKDGTTDELVEVTGGNYRIEPAGIVESYSPRWGALIEKVVGESNTVSSGTAGDAWTGSILVVRHPRSGTINTLVTSDIIQVNEVTTLDAADQRSNLGKIYELLISHLDSSDGADKFKVEQVDFCVNQYGLGQASDDRRDIRIVANARNASGVELIDLDSEKNLCKPKSQI